MAEFEKYLECGKIINTHGVRGNVKIESWCDSVDVLCSLPSIFVMKKSGLVEYEIESASEHKKCALVKLKGVDDMDAALLLKNKVVYADREFIPLDEGSAFIADMIGLDVFRSGNNEKLGTLADVFESVASDIYIVKTEDGREVMVPAVDEFIDEIDVERGIWLSPIPGMFED
jgi:16S rRNA processing protein RimM